jgi:adenosylcobyric acid synthase
MVQGTSSWAGKSLITTALARALARRGYDVVPFKAQNMSNNARVVRGGEIGSAQYLQALAAGVEPDVRMNPVLIKPEGDYRSQVVILGEPDLELSRMPWRKRSSRLWPVIERSLQELRAQHDVLIVEGAGSPAETNLQDTDLANMRTAKAAAARVLLVSDIDRGGAFAHLYGTWAMVGKAERALISGFVLNKFRGDPALLPPGPENLERLTGVRTLGVVPWLDHGLPDEDGVATPNTSSGRPSVAIVRYPTASNLDEFKLLEQVSELLWTDQPAAVDRADLIILPGSKHVADDLAWLRRSGMADVIRARAGRGQPVLGICGGLQMLGDKVVDEAGVDGSADGLGLLPLVTTFAASKVATQAACVFNGLKPPWAALNDIAFRGYQIRHGRTAACGPAVVSLADGLGYVSGSVLAVYVHGMLEEPAVLHALFGARPYRTLDQSFDQLADVVEEHLDMPFILREAGIK